MSDSLTVFEAATPLNAINSLADLACLIATEHAAAVETINRGLRQAKHLGDLLHQARAQVPHGQWLPWLRLNCPFISQRSAQVYMRVSREWPQNRDAQSISGLMACVTANVISEESAYSDDGDFELESEDAVEVTDRAHPPLYTVSVLCDWRKQLRSWPPAQKARSVDAMIALRDSLNADIAVITSYLPRSLDCKS